MLPCKTYSWSGWLKGLDCGSTGLGILVFFDFCAWLTGKPLSDRPETPRNEFYACSLPRRCIIVKVYPARRQKFEKSAKNCEISAPGHFLPWLTRKSLPYHSETFRYEFYAYCLPRRHVIFGIDALSQEKLILEVHQKVRILVFLDPLTLVEREIVARSP